MVRMLGRDQLDYPHLADWVRNDLPRVPEKPKIWGVFKEFGQLNSLNALRALRWGGESPLIRITSLDKGGKKVNGEFRPEHDEWIFFSKEIADRFEVDHALVKARVLVESTILHELVHWGDFKDGIDQPGEEGKTFEKAAYDRDIDRYWPDESTPAAPRRSLNIREIDLSSLGDGWPRGIRNHNPGNIKQSSDRWNGLAKEADMTPEQRDERVFCVFEHPKWGIRAMAIILQKYQKDGRNTVRQMISRWAPSSDGNHTSNYVTFVSGHMEIDSEKVFELADAERAQRMVEAMIAFENGTQPYEDQIIEAGLREASLNV